MKNNLIAFCIINIVFSHKFFAQTPIFISGNEGHKTYRIPAIISVGKGTLLAFAEGRVNGSNDFGDINIVMKKSIDYGKTWSEIKNLVDIDNLQTGNPAPVFDQLDPAHPQGRVFLFYNTGNNHENEVRKGNGIREVWYITSLDKGQSWSEPINITSQVHRPLQPKIDKNYSFKDDWRSYANTPGHAIQLQNGPYKGRLYVPANHSEGVPKSDFTDYYSHAFFTDNHGKTFQLSEKVNLPGSNEATAAELTNGNLLLNARNQKGNIKARIVAKSTNGGESWQKIDFDYALIDPICEGSILNIGQRRKKPVLVFSNASDTLKRDNLTLKISFDEGKTWPKAWLIDKSTHKSQEDFTAYSDIVWLSKNKIGILYERNDYQEIVFKTMNIK